MTSWIYYLIASVGKSPGTAQLCFPLRFLQQCGQDVGHTAYLGRNPFTGSLGAGKIYFLLAVELGASSCPQSLLEATYTF